jgi:hypothetical protein
MAALLARLTLFSGSDAAVVSLLKSNSLELLRLRHDFSAAVNPRIEQSRLKMFSFYELQKTYLYGISLGTVRRQVEA